MCTIADLFTIKNVPDRLVHVISGGAAMVADRCGFVPVEVLRMLNPERSDLLKVADSGRNRPDSLEASEGDYDGCEIDVLHVSAIGCWLSFPTCHRLCPTNFPSRNSASVLGSCGASARG